jgi:hypothetical protein
MNRIALGIAWNWEYDKDFVHGIESECLEHGLPVYRVEPHNVEETVHLLRTEQITFISFLDRASDADESFEPLARLLSKSGCYVVNPYDRVHHAVDKATMHLEFITAGLNVPYTTIISPYNKKREMELSLSELSRLGRPFIIKPANTTGGGTGVVTGAESLKDVVETRQHHKNDKYLLQENIRPVILDGKTAWFRPLYAFGSVFPCWWDHRTHLYREIGSDEESLFGLHPLNDIMHTIKKVCDLDFFSSEIALTVGGKFVVVDYVNEICDMRLQSKYVDGVPDAVVHEVQRKIVASAESFWKHYT